MPPSKEDWIGVDFDRTLAHYERWTGDLGTPIQNMVDHVKRWLSRGQRVKIFTARVNPSNADWREQHAAIQRWCHAHVGQVLEVTCMKDKRCVAIVDDIAVSVEPNRGYLSLPPHMQALLLTVRPDILND